MLELRIILNPNQLPFHQFNDILLDLPIVDLYLLLRHIVTIFIEEATHRRNCRN